MTDLTHIAFLLEEERLRKEDLKRKLSIGEIDMKEYIDSLFVINPELILHFTQERNGESANDVQIIPNLRTRPMTLEEAVSRNLNTNAEYDIAEQVTYGSGLVRAPKFGVKHLK